MHSCNCYTRKHRSLLTLSWHPLRIKRIERTPQVPVDWALSTNQVANAGSSKRSSYMCGESEVEAGPARKRRLAESWSADAASNTTEEVEVNFGTDRNIPGCSRDLLASTSGNRLVKSSSGGTFDDSTSRRPARVDLRGTGTTSRNSRADERRSQRSVFHRPRNTQGETVSVEGSSGANSILTRDVEDTSDEEWDLLLDDSAKRKRSTSNPGSNPPQEHKHWNKQAVDGLYWCTCGKAFDSSSRRSSHVYQQKITTCEICNLEMTISKLRRHITKCRV